ncbi:uncharacterized protein TRIADDRAFT_61872 [Trichoplax adhaerens]|uniref:Uncharacterized protein n=1 Tax=Trichoplax adhaerens TaxID=10228 RepID=B3SC82_TRIAD|nr:predicted protein [Trichoplax adhaerens]EDV19691.1 predicted protein [Trichoplax adhaerens]|eukprot:XP_002117848.1 predicted protein [Trichoplax adhaerens]
MNILNRRWYGLMSRMQRQYSIDGKPSSYQFKALSTFFTHYSNDHALANKEYDHINLSQSLGIRKSKEKYSSPQRFLAEVIRNRTANIMQACQLSQEDASQIACLYSPLFAFNDQAMDMIRFLSKYDCNIKTIVAQHPVILGLDVKQCEAKIDKLRSTISDQHFDPVQLNLLVGEIITKNPTILALSIDNFTSALLSKFAHYDLKSTWILKEMMNGGSESILNHFPTSETNPDNVKKIVRFFYEINVMPEAVLNTAPAVFNLSYDRINAIYLKFTSKPLYFKNKDVKNLFENHGLVLSNLDLDFIEDQYLRLVELISHRRDENLVYLMIAKMPEFLLHESDTRPRVNFLQSFGFTLENISTLYTKLYRSKTLSLPIEENLKPILRILSTAHRRVKIRVEFLRARNPQILINEDLRLLVNCSNNAFMEMCRFSDEEIAEYNSLFDNSQ